MMELGMQVASMIIIGIKHHNNDNLDNHENHDNHDNHDNHVNSDAGGQLQVLPEDLQQVERVILDHQCN